MNWYEINQRALRAELARVRLALVRHAERNTSTGNRPDEPATPARVADEVDSSIEQSALNNLCAMFSLSPFERDTLLVCAGVELDSAFAADCIAAGGDPRKTYPTFSLALAALAEPHWSALLPAAPLRRWRLIELGNVDSLTTSALRIDERILHYLTGLSYLDERLYGLFEPVTTSIELPPSQQAIADRLVELWRESGTGIAAQLFGNDDSARRAIPAIACAALGIPLYLVRASEIPVGSTEREAYFRLWERETMLSSCVLLIDCDRADSSEAARPFIERSRGAIVLAAAEPLRDIPRPLVKIEVRKPRPAEQDALWRAVLGPLAERLNGQLRQVTSQFHLDTASIQAAGAEISGHSSGIQIRAGAELWEICRTQSRRALPGLAQQIEVSAGWDDLVLPEPQRQILREIALHVRHRFTVHEQWGFSQRNSRGLGISTLFSGPSGTGKTMAAEVLASELRLDLYRIDLSQVVSKYIGETEKNLAKVFEAAEGGGAILLFDEADALFGKRSEVKDSHDRYANIEVSYLLQRMESYRGLAILTTNMKSALDPAFLRRIRFIIQFPFPNAVQRAEIWRRVFPRETPTDGLDIYKLAQLNIAGGSIQNVALRAAFLAADAGEPVRMNHLLTAARSEYSKIEKPLTEMEIGGWS
jgi:ATPase family protein associated with various cellular activities (AAA)/winged helix domain-containing protein